jgi:hypothetical protein
MPGRDWVLSWPRGREKTRRCEAGLTRSGADMAMAAEDRGVEIGSEVRSDTHESTDNHSTTAHNLAATETETIPAKQLGHDGAGPA